MLTLASTSPRRRQLLAFGGWSFDVRPVDIDETPLPGERPPDYVIRIARAKAAAAAEGLAPGGIVVAADTTVADGDDILGKPGRPEQAAAMLRRLRGRTHLVFTAVAVVRAGEDEILLDCCSTPVPMRDYSDEEILSYVASGDPFDKAGGYAIQHAGFRPVAQISGCFANVVGLPVCHLLRTLRRLGVESEADIRGACLEAFAYDCAVHADILAGKQSR